MPILTISEIHAHIAIIETRIKNWEAQNQARNCDAQVMAQNIEKIHASKMEIEDYQTELDRLDPPYPLNEIDPEKKFYQDHTTYLERHTHDDDDGDYDDDNNPDIEDEDDSLEGDQPNSPFQKPFLRDDE